VCARRRRLDKQRLKRNTVSLCQTKTVLISVALILTTSHSLATANTCETLFAAAADSAPPASLVRALQFGGFGRLAGNGKSYADAAYGPTGKRPELSPLFVSGTTFVSISQGKLALVDAATGSIRRTFLNFEVGSERASFGPMIGQNKEQAIFVFGRRVRVFDLNADAFIKTFSIESRNAEESTANVSLSSNGQYLYWLGVNGGKQIISMRDGSVLFESKAAPIVSVEIKGHRSHIVESSDGRYVFFVNFDLGTRATASSLLFDTQSSRVISESDSFLDFFKAKPDNAQLFSGILSGVFADGKLIVMQGQNGVQLASEVLYQSRDRREFDLLTESWIEPDFKTRTEGPNTTARTRPGITTRLWNLFTSSVGIRIEQLPVPDGAYWRKIAFSKMKRGQLPYFKVVDERTGDQVSLDVDQISVFHRTGNATMVNPTTVVFSGRYDPSDAPVRASGHVDYGYFGRASLEVLHSEAYVAGQTTWFRLDLISKSVTPIALEQFDALALSDPKMASALELVGVAPDGKTFIFVDSRTSAYFSSTAKF
jgi:hypothetical protein